MSAPLSALPADGLLAVLQRCGLASDAADPIVRGHPFTDDSALFGAVDELVRSLDAPRLVRLLEAVPEPVIERGDADTRNAALLALRLYRERFGYPFVSTGSTFAADELLMRVRIRLGIEPDAEQRGAREQLRRRIRQCLQQASREIPG